MSHQTYDAFLSVVVFVCAAMALVNLLLVRRRGASGYVLASAFIAMGATVYAYKSEAPILWVQFGGGLVVILLAADVFFRGGNARNGRP